MVEMKRKAPSPRVEFGDRQGSKGAKHMKHCATDSVRTPKKTTRDVIEFWGGDRVV